ncbi:MAG: class I SAM-dependent methyltransferase [Deltaproteobacteria bacterium]|nr:class I SAM-dependent methyltransferase [Deltaproteobacteria bacterium]
MIITACRACSGELAEIVSLGQLPLANNYLLPEAATTPESRYPLDLVRCRACSLVQITYTVPPDVLFKDYLYLSSYSTTMLRHAEELVTRVIVTRMLGPNSLVAEVASNDGYLLQNYVRAGVPVLGIEPAANVAEIARGRGVHTVEEFFDAGVATRLRDTHASGADVIHANNVLAHVAELNGFVDGFRVLLADDGVLISESPYLADFLRKVEFDTIYHEHLCYYSLTALTQLFRRHDLEVVDCERLSIHGGSLRIFVRHARVARPSARVTQLLDEEREWGVAEARPYARFAAEIERVKREVITLIRDLRKQGRRVSAYGAAAKGTVMLNVCALGLEDIEFVCDKSPLKQGRVMPGVHVPIVSPDHLEHSGVDYCLLLAWNVADEIRREQAAWESRGGRFIVPSPTVQVLG